MDKRTDPRDLNTYGPMLVRYFSKRDCGDLSADLAQETLIKAIKGLKQFRGDASLKTWLFRIARHTLIEYWNSTKKLRPISGSPISQDQEETIEENSGQHNPEKRLMVDEGLKLLGNSVDELPPKMKQVFFFRVFHKMKYHEIAQVLDMNINTVKSNLNHARTRLKDKLDGYYHIMGGNS